MKPSPPDLSDPERIRLIRKALVDCGQDPTPDAISTQFHRETGRLPESDDRER